MTKMKNIERVGIIFQIGTMWIITYGVSWLATLHIRTDNWLFGVILVPVSVLIGAISLIVTVKGAITLMETNKRP